MDPQRTSAILLIAGFMVLTFGFVASVRGIYQTPDLTKRVQMINEEKYRWIVGQSSLALGFVIITVGYGFLVSRLRSEGSAWIPTIGAVCLIAGLVSGIYFIYRQTTDPLGAFSGQYPGFEPLYNGLSLAGLILMGISFLQVGLPAWLGFLTGGSALLYLIIFLLTGSGFLTPGFVSLLGLVVAVVLLWQKPLP
jgi:hypothetical protein